MAAELAHSPAANALGEHMSDISQEVYAAGWMRGTEWVLWQALTDWRATGRAYWSPGSEFPGDITEHMPELDRLQKAAGGWVWWLDGMQFVPEDRWLRLVAVREASPWGWQTENRELDAAVTA
ncbi:hypothetical protein [Micromonospora sp. CA-248212]|uniref:hypothetical protein n=1 Tax=Micromonospora sp. CA-248212 TaxID=3239961 RepID=UPI003D90930B